ncbi:hypothetical protein COZ35_01560, partial [Candidatus Peregrinibacteria bacterium CG_4_10_14_3_um_filter_44_21]
MATLTAASLCASPAHGKNPESPQLTVAQQLQVTDVENSFNSGLQGVESACSDDLVAYERSLLGKWHIADRDPHVDAIVGEDDRIHLALRASGFAGRLNRVVGFDLNGSNEWDLNASCLPDQVGSLAKRMGVSFSYGGVDIGNNVAFTPNFGSIPLQQEAGQSAPFDGETGHKLIWDLKPEHPENPHEPGQIELMIPRELDRADTENNAG